MVTWVVHSVDKKQGICRYKGQIKGMIEWVWPNVQVGTGRVGDEKRKQEASGCC